MDWGSCSTSDCFVHHPQPSTFYHYYSLTIWFPVLAFLFTALIIIFCVYFRFTSSQLAMMYITDNELLHYNLNCHNTVYNHWHNVSGNKQTKDPDMTSWYTCKETANCFIQVLITWFWGATFLKDEIKGECNLYMKSLQTFTTAYLTQITQEKSLWLLINNYNYTWKL